MTVESRVEIPNRLISAHVLEMLLKLWLATMNRADGVVLPSLACSEILLRRKSTPPLYDAWVASRVGSTGLGRLNSFAYRVSPTMYAPRTSFAANAQPNRS